jgi:streptogramin lyase
VKSCRILLGCILALLCLLSCDLRAQVVTEFSAGISAGAELSGITAGPDGNLWFTESGVNRIGRITPQGVVTEFSAGISARAGLRVITVGPDGNLWFTESGINQIGRITPQGVVTEFRTGITAGAQIVGITAGPDGNVWFTESGINRIGRITPQGVVTEFSTGGIARPYQITAGPDGNLWYTGFRDRIGRMTPLGVVTEFSEGIQRRPVPWRHHGPAPTATCGSQNTRAFRRAPVPATGSGGFRPSESSQSTASASPAGLLCTSL